jgi:Family of unknown function (DUF5706)
MEQKRTEWDGDNLVVIEPQHSINKMDFLWKTIQRFDFYINSTNTKASSIIAFNTFVLGGIVLKASEILPPKGVDHYLYLASGVCLIISAIASLVSLIATFFVISPFLKSSGDTDTKVKEPYSSTIFFADIAKLSSSNQLLEQVKSSSDEVIYEDLSIQAYSLAQGLDGKFKKIKMIFYWILFVQLPTFGGVIAIKLYTLIFL